MRSSRTVLKALSVTLTAAFGLQSAVWAAPLAPVASADPLTVAPAVHFELPPSVALIDDRHAGSGDKLVILVQDAHTNESGQMNIARALGQVLAAESVRTVYTEGAAAGMDVTPFALKEGDLALREKVGQSYLRKGLINGSEYLAMTSPTDFTIRGTEDETLYEEAGELYRTAADDRKTALRWIDRLSRSLNELKNDLWSDALRSLDADRERYRSGQMPLTDYFERLAVFGIENGIDPYSYPNLKDLMSLRAREGRIDWKRAAGEEARSLKGLSEDVRRQLAGMRTTYSPFKRSAVPQQGPDGFFAALEAALLDQDPDSARVYPVLFDYFSYVRDTRSLSAPDAIQELEALERAVWKAMTPDVLSAQLESYGAAAGRMKRIAELQASPNDFDTFESDPRTHDPAYAAAWVNRRIEDLDKHYERVVTMDPEFEAAFEAAVNFYRVNGLRDRVIAGSIDHAMTASGEMTAVLVTGGFHVPNLKRLLASRGFSYVSILPQVTHETDLVRYERLVRDAVQGLQRSQDLDRTDHPSNAGRPEFGSRSAGEWMLPAVASPSRLTVVQRIERELHPEPKDPNVRIPGPPPAVLPGAGEKSQELAVTRPISKAVSRSAVAVIREADTDPSEARSGLGQALPDEIAGVMPLSLSPAIGSVRLEDVRAGRLAAELKPYFAATAASPLAWSRTLTSIRPGTLLNFVYSDGHSENGRVIQSGSRLGQDGTMRVTLSYETLSGKADPAKGLGARLALPAPVDLPGGLFLIKRYYEQFDPDSPIPAEGYTPTYEYVADLGPAFRVTEQVLFENSARSAPAGLSGQFDLLAGHVEAARAVYGWMNDLGPQGVFAKDRSDAGATAAIRRAWQRFGNSIKIRSVVSEGERDFKDAAGVHEHYAMISIGEEIRGRRPVIPEKDAPRSYDAALDVLEVTNSVSSDAFLGAASVGTYATRGALQGFPDYYLSKWAVGPSAASAELSFEAGTAENIRRISEASGKPVSQLRGSVLFRPAHIRLIVDLIKAGIDAGNDAQLKNLVALSEAYEAISGAELETQTPAALAKRAELKKAFGQIKARLKKTGYLRLGNLNLLADGDLLPAVALGLPDDAEGHLDFLVGRGGTSEGVMAASAVKAIGGKIIATLVSHDQLNEDAFDADLFRDGKDFSPEELARLASEFELYPAGDPKAGDEHLGTVYTGDDLVRTDDFVFIATSVKPHALIPGLDRPVLSDDGRSFQTTSLWVTPGSVRLITVLQPTRIDPLADSIQQVKAEIMKAYRDGDDAALEGLKSTLAAQYHDLARTYLFFQRFGEARYYFDRSVQIYLELSQRSKAASASQEQFEKAAVSEEAASLHAQAIQVLQTGVLSGGVKIENPALAAFDLLEEALELKPVQIDTRLRTGQLHIQLAEFLGDAAATAASTSETDTDKLAFLSAARDYYKRGADRDSLAVSQVQAKYQALLPEILELETLLGPAGARLTNGHRPSDLITKPRLVSAVPVRRQHEVQVFAASAVLVGSVSEGSDLPVLPDDEDGYALVRIGSVTPVSVRLGFLGGDETEAAFEPIRSRRAGSLQDLTGPSRPELSDPIQSEIALQEEEGRAAAEALAGLGVEEMFHRIPVGFLFPENRTDQAGRTKTNLNDDQIRGQILSMLHRLIGVYGNGENGRYITPYLDTEGLSPANRQWLQTIVALPAFARFHILSDKDPIPDGLVINWYVDKGHKNYRTDLDPERHETRGPNLLVPATRPGLEQSYERYLTTSFNFIRSVLTDVSVLPTREAADQFERAAGFTSAEIWEKRLQMFRDPRAFESAADLFLRAQGGLAYEASQVASYRLFKNLSEWVQLQREMTRRARIAA